MIIVSASVGFLWYTLVREAQTIQPLLPALQSWWMKLHVPATSSGMGRLYRSYDGLCLPD